MARGVRRVWGEPACESDFLARVHRSPNGSCWLFIGHRAAHGYRRFCVSNKMPLAHRLMWDLVNGPIPPGLEVCHRCDNPPCCNPAHLFLGTRKENAMDCAAKGRLAPQGGQTHCWRGHQFTDANVRFTRSGSRDCRRCGTIRSRERRARIALGLNSDDARAIREEAGQ